MKNLQESTGRTSITRYEGYDRIMGGLSWLLIALVSLDIKLLPRDDPAGLFLVVFCFLLLLYNVATRCWLLKSAHRQFKIFIDLIVFLLFIVGASWVTGKATSPFISLLYLILMATSLTQGKRATYFMAGLAISSYLLLGSEQLLQLIMGKVTLLSYLLELFPFMLIGHLGAMLAGEAEEARREIERLSLTDDITGIHNMRNFFRLARIQKELADRHQRSYAVCMFDSDNLKVINDAHGHLAGTELIRLIAAVLSKNLRGSDVVARYGGDEFIVLFPETNSQSAAIPAERIRRTMEEASLEFNGTTLRTTLSIGIASYPEHGDDIEAVMAHADQAMYTSKREGKNRVTLYTPEPEVEVEAGEA